MTKPTPEPWKVNRDPMGALIVSGPEGETVFYTGTMDEDCANADLVVDARKTAAERDRLKAVNSVRSYRQMKAAIAKYEEMER